MSQSIPSLPSFHALPFFMAIDGLSGYLYGHVSQVDPNLTMVIFAIRGIAHTAFYLLANAIVGSDGLRSHYVYLATSIVVNMTFLIVLRELNLIGRFFSCLIGLTVIGHLINRVRYIQNQEKKIGAV